MKPPYYTHDDQEIMAFVQQISYFYFWYRWYWNIKFYHPEYYWSHTPYDDFDGFASTEQEALDKIKEKIEELIPDHG